MSDGVRDNLLKKLENTLRTVATNGAQYKLLREQQQRVVAEALARGDKAMMQKTEEERFEARFLVYKNLMNEARYDILKRQSDTAEILQGLMRIQEQARVKGLPVPPATQAAYTQTLAAYNLQVQQDLRPERERNFLAIMLEVEKAHIPLPDEPPIHFMTRLPASQQVKAWEILSKRRKELYENADFMDDPKGRKEADALWDLLESYIETKSFQQIPDLKLKEFLGLSAPWWKRKAKNCPFSSTRTLSRRSESRFDRKHL